jgi:hypothetical protein
LSWLGHGEKPSTPVMNSAETLNQFIDSLGVGVEETRTPPFNNFTVVVE